MNAPLSPDNPGELEIPIQWDRCEIHNYPGSGFDIFFKFFHAKHCVSYEQKPGKNGSSIIVIKPSTSFKLGFKELYLQVFGEIQAKSPDIEILFY